MSCILRVSGKDFDVDQILKESGLKAYKIYRKGELSERKTEGEFNSDSGFAIEVSKADFDKLAVQIEDAINFLKVNQQSLTIVGKAPGKDYYLLDFAFHKRDVAVQYDYFPAELLRLAGNLGIGIELSCYDL
jgi:hypothetical protein